MAPPDPEEPVAADQAGLAAAADGSTGRLGRADATGTRCVTGHQWAAGLRALAAQRLALAVILFCALDSAVYGAATVLYVPLSVRLGTGAAGYSYLLAGAALGGVLGAGLANRLSGASRLAPVIMGSICLQALPFLATVPVRWPALRGFERRGWIEVRGRAVTVKQAEALGRFAGN